ncbi:MAG: prephenate dehydrogenase [Firmicutes bacterium]|nr:prephenate dehydrogenase [Bacillota bacterium]
MGFKVAILGLGLIGASLGLAFRDSSLVEAVAGYDHDPDTVEKALEIGVIDEAGGLREVVDAADFTFVCVPLEAMEELCSLIAPWLKPGSILTDVGGVKSPVLDWMRRLPPMVYAVGGHPMAGSERTGVISADRYLFENALYVITPFDHTPPEVISRLTRLLQETGARVKSLDAATHDRSVAVVSHLPHVMAYALLNLLEGCPEGSRLAAGSFRDLTRVAASNSVLWEDILLCNRGEVVASITGLMSRLDALRQCLVAGDRLGLSRCIESAQKIRQDIPQLQKGLLPVSYEIIAVVPDRPGVIGQLGQWLGEQGVNIVDIEILRVREGDGGTIRIGVPTEEAAETAVAAIRQQGVTAWRR